RHPQRHRRQRHRCRRSQHAGRIWSVTQRRHESTLYGRSGRARIQSLSVGCRPQVREGPGTELVQDCPEGVDVTGHVEWQAEGCAAIVDGSMTLKCQLVLTRCLQLLAEFRR
ncbi:hypothetical protein RvY_11437, partial [Ramazzottius varieornatus]